MNAEPSRPATGDTADTLTGQPARVAVFGPHPLLGATIERSGSDRDDIHYHAGGQGVWVTRMAGEMGAEPVLCSFCGGESGRLLAPLLEDLPGEVRLVETATASGSYVVDRRSGAREMIASAWSDPPSRHEIDDLFSLATAAALNSVVMVVCGTAAPDTLPLEVFRNLVRDARGGDATVIVDLSAPQLEAALDGRPDVVKANDWQLAEYVVGPVSEPAQMRAACDRVLAAGAESVLLTRGGEPAFFFRGDEIWELVPPRFEGGSFEGSGDSMVGALAAALALGASMEEALRVGAAAGAANFLRHGLGTGSRAVVEELVERVALRPLSGAQFAAAVPAAPG
jgi:1-phosphofructokinase